MTNYEHLKSLPIEKLSTFLSERCDCDNAPWYVWFDKVYCSKCDSIMCHHSDSNIEFPCSWCELHDWKCKFFPDMPTAPEGSTLVTMWLAAQQYE